MLVQYIALRGDLLRTQKWPVGALVAQGCHACTAVIHTHRDSGNVVQYLSDLDRMHKVVLEVDHYHKPAFSNDEVIVVAGNQRSFVAASVESSLLRVSLAGHKCTIARKVSLNRCCSLAL